MNGPEPVKEDPAYLTVLLLVLNAEPSIPGMLAKFPRHVASTKVIYNFDASWFSLMIWLCSIHDLMYEDLLMSNDYRLNINSTNVVFQYVKHHIRDYAILFHIS
ncbi:unnamed protein product [Schistosoma mattheei]|uniref:Uncharacterized protein n=1 Tax=Schistosoma mattheei TaxID=31246 RepID=A0A3P7ZBF8_9TREM|nr:unnamed protein product [Schistosoma mattheei]